jgi:hypothetical protein
MRTISLCLTNYNRLELLLKSFADVYDDERISEIVISDDASDIGIYNDLKRITNTMPKVKLHRNGHNMDCFVNKAISITLATNKYCILLDSDNHIDKSYIDAIYEYEWQENVALMPDWAMPLFSYTDYSGVVITKENISQYIDKPMLETCLNCANYFVNREFYLNAFNDSVDPVTSDSLWQNYNWLLNGGKIHIVDGLRYQHLVHDGSHYKINNSRTGNFKDILIEKIRLLS